MERGHIVWWSWCFFMGDSKGSLPDYFEFCYQVSRQDFKEVRRLELAETLERGATRSYMDIDHIVGTNYFVVAHGGN